MKERMHMIRMRLTMRKMRTCMGVSTTKKTSFQSMCRLKPPRFPNFKKLRKMRQGRLR